jgi:hypothetical protein
MGQEQVDRVVEDLSEKAEAERKELDPSFRERLAEYARKEGVRRLDDEDVAVVLEEVGRRTIERAGEGERVGRPEVDRLLRELCPEAFNDCEGAAHRILEGG